MRNDPSTQLPKARKDQLIVKELPDETLVYDLADDRAHCLNQTAALVWKNCDGRRTVTELGECLKDELGTGVASDVVWLALDQLEEFKLLELPIARPTEVAGMSRRQLVRTLGLAAAVSIPLITSIVVPTPAQALSNIAKHDPCCPGDTCVPGNTCVAHPSTPPCNMWCN